MAFNRLVDAAGSKALARRRTFCADGPTVGQKRGHRALGLERVDGCSDKRAFSFPIGVGADISSTGNAGLELSFSKPGQDAAILLDPLEFAPRRLAQRVRQGLDTA